MTRQLCSEPSEMLLLLNLLQLEVWYLDLPEEVVEEKLWQGSVVGLQNRLCCRRFLQR
jgi:hypothetical protein